MCAEIIAIADFIDRGKALKAAVQRVKVWIVVDVFGDLDALPGSS